MAVKVCRFDIAVLCVIVWFLTKGDLLSTGFFIAISPRHI